ncbi:MAG: serine/threonine-protein kinase [Gammaproteobacteria bacterium]|nr:serine/threonine-protein kinase [Gammaproteobacteria bacterium]MCZ6773791.1 serine/threonine-protein kinase [Pseudomonadota bacterium]MCZ6894618.1 serine/threonine-protein kinase [Gammaproteobacteria bacterium]
MSAEVPENLGKYNVISEIDRGSMGTVYLGHDPYIDRNVAIKVAHPEQLNDEEGGDRFRKMFFNEAHTAGRLTHPNIIGIYDAGVDGDTCYIVMELVEGGETLKKFCRQDNLLPIEKVVETVFKCAKALDYAHKQGVIHRDIKPTNILVTKDGDVKIGDFSIAHLSKMDSTDTMPMGLVGSPRYMSPEQVSEDYITSQTDLFSLGIVMYELLAGKHPFAAETFSRLVQRILNEDPPAVQQFRTDIPNSLVKILNKALAKSRDDRYQMGMELASELSIAFDALLERPEENISEQEQFQAVKQLDFFEGFPDAEIWEIVRAGKWQDYRDRDEIIVEGELDDSFYIIVKGQVWVQKGGKDLRALMAGDCFGEMGYLAKTKRSATIAATGATSLLKVNSTVISQVSLNCQVRFLKVFLRTLIHRLSVTTEKMSQEI